MPSTASSSRGGTHSHPGEYFSTMSSSTIWLRRLKTESQRPFSGLTKARARRKICLWFGTWLGHFELCGQTFVSCGRPLSMRRGGEWTSRGLASSWPLKNTKSQRQHHQTTPRAWIMCCGGPNSILKGSINRFLKASRARLHGKEMAVAAWDFGRPGASKRRRKRQKAHRARLLLWDTQEPRARRRKIDFGGSCSLMFYVFSLCLFLVVLLLKNAFLV